MAFEQERAEGQRLAGRPVDALARLDHPLRLSRKRWIVRWTLKPAGTVVSAGRCPCRVSSRNAGLAAARIVAVFLRRLEAGPAAVEPVGLVRLVALRGLELGCRAWLRQAAFISSTSASVTTPSPSSFFGVDLAASTDAGGSSCTSAAA